MSIKIGTVDPTSAIPTHTVVAVPGQINVYVSAAGVELVAVPCVLSIEQARELAGILRIAIGQAERRSVGAVEESGFHEGGFRHG